METLPIRNRRLLVIDERQADRDRVCGLLQGTLGAESPPVAPERGYQVDTAGSAEEALGRIRSALQADAPYAVVFRDAVGRRGYSRSRAVLASRLPLAGRGACASRRFSAIGAVGCGRAPAAPRPAFAGTGGPPDGRQSQRQVERDGSPPVADEPDGGCHPGDHPGSRPGQGRRWRKRSASARNWKANWCRRRSLPRSATHAGVAHEINNPISYVSSNYTTLEEHVRRLLEVLEAYEEARPAIRDEALARRLEQLGERVELAFVKEDVAVLLRESRKV